MWGTPMSAYEVLFGDVEGSKEKGDIENGN